MDSSERVVWNNYRNVEILTRPDSLKSLERAWNGLYKRCGCKNIFSSFAWNYCWLRNFGRKYDSISIVVLRDGAEIRGIAPLVLKRESFYGFKARTLKFSGDTDSVYKDFLAEGCHTVLLEPFFNRLQGGAHSWDLIVLDSIPRDSALSQKLPAMAGKRSFPFIREKWSTVSVVNVPASYASLPHRIRRKLQKDATLKIRRLRKIGSFASTTYTGSSAGAEHIERAADIERRSWKGTHSKGIFFDSEHLQFHSDLLKYTEKDFEPYVSFVTFQDEDMAYQYGFLQGNCYYMYNMSFDEKYGRHSPGWIVADFLIRDLIDRRMGIYDLMTGINDFKRAWEPEFSSLDRIIVFNGSPFGRFLYAMYRMKMIAVKTPFYRLIKKRAENEKKGI